MENNMTPEEKFNQKMWWLLQQIKEADLLRSPEEPFEFLIQQQKDAPPKDDQRKLVYKLENLKAIKISKQFTYIDSGLTKVIFKENASESEANGFHLKILPKFDEVYGEFREKAELLKENTTKKELKQKSGTIDKIIIVKPKDGNRFKIIINDDYHQRPLDGDMAKPSWNLLFRVADGDLIEDQEYKSSFDFFNSNEKCRLYTQTGYPKTKILKRESGYIKPAVKMEIITEKAYKQRCKKG
ncbi:hypothetical protein KJ786_00150 [Patescibacteria group bacterium]|nr:hypothetical protein [Patescibacteria group bacterium]